MERKQLALLLHPLFLISIIFLLLNDFCFKYLSPNWLTGKISDYAGLFSFTIFCFAFFPKSKRAVIIFVALFFIWWKSSLSDFTISFLNDRLSIPVKRTIDYSDLLALIVLIPALYIKPASNKNSLASRFAITCVGIISLISFTATSLPRRLADDNKVLLDKYVKTRKEKDTILKALEEDGLGPVRNTFIYEKIWEDKLYYKIKDSDTVYVKTTESLFSGVYRKLDYGSAYLLPKMYVAGDSIHNLKFIISDFNGKKNLIRLYSFEYNKKDADSGFKYTAYYAWRKFKKPIKKKIKAVLK